MTSVKVHHQPGGQSSFSLAHDTGADDRFAGSGKVGQQPKPSGGAPWGTDTQAQ